MAGLLKSAGAVTMKSTKIAELIALLAAVLLLLASIRYSFA